MLETEEEVSDQSELIELIQFLKANPININTADVQQLQLIPWLSPVLAGSIIQYRNKVGRFDSLEELRKVPGMLPQTYETIRDFLTVKDSRYFLQETSRTRLIEKLEKARGFKNGIYYNSPQKFYHRMAVKLGNNIQTALLVEKDPGEKQWNDLSLYYLRIDGLSERSKLLLGHYHLELGQGLTFWGPYGFSKGAESVSMAKRRSRGLVEYHSVEENASLFGAAGQVEFSRFSLAAFASRTKLDASLNAQGNVSHFYETGLHRSQQEMDKKDQLQEYLMGGSLAFQSGSGIKLSGVHYISRYSKSIENPDFIRNRFAFRGKENRVTGLNFDLFYKNMNLFGEVVYTGKNARGLLCGLILDFDRMAFAVLFRDYDKALHSRHGAAFGRHSGFPQNERGFYSGFTWHPTSKTTFSAYYDHFKSPWRGYLEPMPVRGEEFLTQITHKIDKDILLTLRLKTQEMERSLIVWDSWYRAKDILVSRQQWNLRVQLEYQLCPQVRLRGRVEKIAVTYNSKYLRKFTGILMYQDIGIRWFKKLKVQGRLTFFDTPSYDARIYQFENDLAGVMTNRALYGKGTRCYMLLVYDLLKQIRVSLKYAIDYLEGVDTIGSGWDEIDGDKVRVIG
ncbi:MAG: helix-hairpin-helix domain-containing protein, partial [candidate division KSB1 bacterium]|nr:helix-hairpin-helix domain-containing protein [candidate division KSB1 bacterium]